MATSGSIDFSLNRNEIILDACEEIGIAIDGEPLEPEVVTVANRVLNRMIKAWMPHGLFLWKRDTKSITLVAATNTYTLGPTGTVSSSTRPLRILECDREDTNSISVGLNKLSLQEYDSLSNKTSTGTPVSYFYSPDIPNGTLKVWPTPDATVAAEYTIEITYQAPFEDFDNATDDPDFPAEWIEAIVYGLATRLARKYGSLSVYEQQDLKKQAQDSLELALSGDVEDGSIYFQPNIDTE